MMQAAYTNCTIFTGSHTEKDKAILVKNNVVEKMTDINHIPAGYKIEDLQGINVAPAFIDLQIYGGNGKLFSAELTTAAIAATYQYCVSGGCTQFMLTMATSSIEDFLKGMEAVREYQTKGGKGLLGLHMEGPYINPAKKGAHALQHIKKPTIEEVRMLLDKGRGILKMMTLAPEMCDEKIIRLLKDEGILVSAGHSNATYAEASKGFATGIPAATHLFNAMSAFQSREPGMVGAIYNNDAVRCSVVTDGIHVDFVSVRISKKLMGERLFFITDAVTETTKGNYKHVFNRDRYALPDGTLSGSALTMMQSVRNGVYHVGIPVEEALRMASSYPAQLLQLPVPLGKIAPGYAAEFVLFNDNLELQGVIIGNNVKISSKSHV